MGLGDRLKKVADELRVLLAQPELVSMAGESSMETNKLREFLNAQKNKASFSDDELKAIGRAFHTLLVLNPKHKLSNSIYSIAIRITACCPRNNVGEDRESFTDPISLNEYKIDSPEIIASSTGYFFDAEGAKAALNAYNKKQISVDGMMLCEIDALALERFLDSRPVDINSLAKNAKLAAEKCSVALQSSQRRSVKSNLELLISVAKNPLQFDFKEDGKKINDILNYFLSSYPDRNIPDDAVGPMCNAMLELLGALQKIPTATPLAASSSATAYPSSSATSSPAVATGLFSASSRPALTPAQQELETLIERVKNYRSNNETKKTSAENLSVQLELIKNSGYATASIRDAKNVIDIALKNPENDKTIFKSTFHSNLKNIYQDALGALKKLENEVLPTQSSSHRPN